MVAQTEEATCVLLSHTGAEGMVVPLVFADVAEQQQVLAVVAGYRRCGWLQRGGIK